MANLDLERAKNLLKSAKGLYEEGDIHGVAGLAYQAFESANIALIKEKNGCDQKSHYGRRKRAKELLAKYQDKIDMLWEVRNIDFYGNIILDGDERDIDARDVKSCLDIVEMIVLEISNILAEKM